MTVPDAAAAIENVREEMGKLAAHGSPDQIALFLLRHDSTGDHLSMTCPVAMWLRARTRHIVAVGSTTFTVPYLSAEKFPVPAAVAEFLRAFDRHVSVWPTDPVLDRLCWVNARHGAPES